jgi:hypothetical protein
MTQLHMADGNTATHGWGSWRLLRQEGHSQLALTRLYSLIRNLFNKRAQIYQTWIPIPIPRTARVASLVITIIHVRPQDDRSPPHADAMLETQSRYHDRYVKCFWVNRVVNYA